ncbi:MAG: sensor histidine kinase, partial [Lachnospiraceae bacterium]
EVPVPVMYCFLTITKEALSNITRHSNADAIRISMKEYTSLYQLSIADNGTNASLPQNSSGMGLENMQARVASLNGTIRFSVQGGFHIFVSLPKEH